MLGLLSPGSAEAYIGWGGKPNSHLMASCVRTIHTKNYQNLIIGFQVTVKNVGDVFWDTVYLNMEMKSTVVNFTNHTMAMQVKKNSVLHSHKWNKSTCSVSVRCYRLNYDWNINITTEKCNILKMLNRAADKKMQHVTALFGSSNWTISNTISFNH